MFDGKNTLRPIPRPEPAETRLGVTTMSVLGRLAIEIPIASWSEFPAFKLIMFTLATKSLQHAVALAMALDMTAAIEDWTPSLDAVMQ